ncbi:hypothetical protein F0919_05080 [Taibaiella lutea]|uniref:PH domain-containing protein n=1 Tax=Taibaiella lutea TaxID=2608001 RepID=A0A5M6CV24_9BACT|nr:hypothetical protein [Taibaiella lutea]KAA5537049.1 hypothetical protein F0919_05080 [Taibaiella lutea]
MKTFVASRISAGNRLFPDKVTVEDNGITLRTPNLFGGKEKMLLYRQINSVETSNPLVGFSSIKFKTNNFDTIECKGFTKDETDEIKRLVNIGINNAFGSGNGSISRDNEVSDNRVSLERERLEIDKKRLREERADKLRQEGRPIHALMVEYSETLSIVGGVLLILFFISLSRCK